MSEKEIVRLWNSAHDAYATIDRNPTDQNKVIVAKGNRYITADVGDGITEKLLDTLYKELCLEEK